MCPYCRADRNAGEAHKAGCSAPDNVRALPPMLALKITNRSPHTLALRPTADPSVYEVICGHELRERAVDLLVIGLTDIRRLHKPDVGQNPDLS